ncbi:MAG: MepB family protein [Fluviicola sp.]|jgi:hypothetical protein
MYDSLRIAKDLLYDKCDFEFSQLQIQKESSEYEACSFKLNDKLIQYRKAKITPTKTGQFVTIWKRNSDGITEPFSYLDTLDFIVITVIKDTNRGQFIFPKALLLKHSIIRNETKDGKRGIRVYAPWDKVTSKQAEKTKAWQTGYFVNFDEENTSTQDLVKKIING